MKGLLLVLLVAIGAVIVAVIGCQELKRTNPVDVGGENYQPSTIA